MMRMIWADRIALGLAATIMLLFTSTFLLTHQNMAEAASKERKDFAEWRSSCQAYWNASVPADLSKDQDLLNSMTCGHKQSASLKEFLGREPVEEWTFLTIFEKSSTYLAYLIPFWIFLRIIDFILGGRRLRRQRA